MTTPQSVKQRVSTYCASEGLARDVKRGVLFGVCAGLARFLKVDLTVLRILTVIFGVLFFWPTILAYGLAVFLLGRRDTVPTNSTQQTYVDPTAPSTTVHRNYSAPQHAPAPPPPTAEQVNGEFDHIEQRLRGLEAYLSTKEFELDREFRRLDTA